VTFVPRGMRSASRSICARAGRLGDICAAQIHALHERGLDVHLAIPNYRNVFNINARRMAGVDSNNPRHELPESRIHLAQDRSFYYHPKLFLTTDWENIRIALAFQREVINRIIPEVQPDLIHCYDWMTGLIPAMARRNGIACLFTLYRLDSAQLLLSTIEEWGIDAASFWQHLCFWPTRLDGSRSGCRLMADTLAVILDRYRERRLQVVFVADGDFQAHMRGLIVRLNASDRAAVCDFDARRYRLAYGGSDFVLMPQYFDPCALPCKIGQRYGALSIAHDAGAIHDCVAHLDPPANRGTGFLFKYFDANGFLWAIDQAMAFYRQSPAHRSSQVQRIMTDSLVRFNAGDTARQTIALYGRALGHSFERWKSDSSLTTPSQIAA
jgi:glycogen synthase